MSVSPIFNRSTTLKTYDDQNILEHEFISSMGDEFIQIHSPRIIYFKLNSQKTFQETDEVSSLYQETEIMHHYEPIEVFALKEASPIIQELTRLGLTQIMDVNLIVNVSDFEKRLMSAGFSREESYPNSGDLMLINEVNIHGKSEKNFYVIASVVASDPVLNRETNYLINAEQTSLDNVPEDIRDFLTKDF